MYAVETIFRISVLASTTLQRWQALKNINNYNFAAERWFTQLCIIAIIILMILFFIVTFKRIRRERQINDNLFLEFAEQRGLTAGERQILFEITRKAGLKQQASIFSMASAFNAGSDKMKRDLLVQQNFREINYLEVMLSSLREKLGFKKEVSFSRGSPAKSEKLSSRQIPTGKEVYITRQNSQDSESIKATVIKNNDAELAIQLIKPVKIVFGEYWKVRYYLSSSFWEFDSLVLSYDGNIMVLSHSDNVRFINRRRFARSPVRKQAFIAHFPFEMKLSRSIETVTEKNESGLDFPDIPLRPLQFVPAVVTELGGPGLRIETSIKINPGDRVLIMFELDREKERNSKKNPETGEVVEFATTILRVVEDIGIVQEIGEVKRTEESPGNYTMAIELTGLRDSDLDCLIQATNAASMNVSGHNEQIPDSVENFFQSR